MKSSMDRFKVKSFAGKAGKEAIGLALEIFEIEGTEGEEDPTVF